MSRPTALRDEDSERIGNVIISTYGNLSKAARVLEVDWRTLKSYIDRNHKMNDYINEGIEKSFDELEVVVFNAAIGRTATDTEAAIEPDPKLALQILKAKGTSRGYSPKVTAQTINTIDDALDKLEASPEKLVYERMKARGWFPEDSELN